MRPTVLDIITLPSASEYKKSVTKLVSQNRINPFLFTHQVHSNSPMGLNPSSQIHPILTNFVGDGNVALLCDSVLLSRVSNAEDCSSDILNQLSSHSTGDSLNSNELFGEAFDSSPKTSSPFRNDVSVVTKGRNVTGNRCCSSNVYRVLCGEEVVLDCIDCILCGDDDDDDGVVV